MRKVGELVYHTLVMAFLVEPSLLPCARVSFFPSLQGGLGRVFYYSFLNSV